MPRAFQEFWRYVAASALALALDTTLFTCSLRWGASVPAASAAGFLSGLGLIYTLSTRHVFAQHRIADRRMEFLGFAAIGMAGLGLTELILWLTITQAGMPALPAKMISAGATFMSNFLLRRGLLFTRHPAPPTQAP